MGDYSACVGTAGADITNGAFQDVTGIRFEEVSDGLTNTLMVGEKHLPLGQDGKSPWDCGIYDGHNVSCVSRAAGPGYPLATSREEAKWKFGSRHPGQCQFVFCDGSVRPLANTIDPAVLGLLAQRNDGRVLPND